MEFTSGAAASIGSCLRIELARTVANSLQVPGQPTIRSLNRQRGGGLVQHRGCFNNLRVGHRVCRARCAGQVGCASTVVSSGGGSCRAVGQPRIEGLANLRLQLSAAGAIMTAAAAEADR
jgi:hypothetical protein